MIRSISTWKFLSFRSRRRPPSHDVKYLLQAETLARKSRMISDFETTDDNYSLMELGHNTDAIGVVQENTSDNNENDISYSGHLDEEEANLERK